MQKVSHIMFVSFMTNLLLSLTKIVTGIIFTSSSLIADGIHSFSDLITDIVAIIGDFISRKPADNKHPYGHGKLEYMTSLFIGIIILVLGFLVIANYKSDDFVIPSILVCIVSIFTIICKLLLSSFLIKKGNELKNNILISSGKESSMDVLSSVVVLLAAVLMQFSDKLDILKYSDIVATIIIGLFIVKVGFTVIKDNVSILIGECETDEEVLNELKNIILNIKNIQKIDSINLFKYGSYYELVCEVSIDGNLSFKQAHDTVHLLEDKIKINNSKIKYVSVHANPYLSENL